MTIAIRPLQKIEEYHAFLALERTVWQNIQPVPEDVLITAQKNGGLVLGAFLPAEDGEDKLVGLLFGFPGLTAAGKIKHCSHIVGVHPSFRDRQVGRLLKQEQRRRVLAQGLDLVTWTYDPLQSRNAWLNLHKLGAVCNTYLSNLYGEMSDGINKGMTSDRFQVDWHIASRHVAQRMGGVLPRRKLDGLLRAGVWLVNGGGGDAGGFPPTRSEPMAGHQILIRFPADISRLKSIDIQAARAWRRHTSELFQAAFANGYVAIDVLHEGDSGYYLLERGWQPS